RILPPLAPTRWCSSNPRLTRLYTHWGLTRSRSATSFTKSIVSFTESILVLEELFAVSRRTTAAVVGRRGIAKFAGRGGASSPTPQPRWQDAHEPGLRAEARPAAPVDVAHLEHVEERLEGGDVAADRRGPRRPDGVVIGEVLLQKAPQISSL